MTVASCVVAFVLVSTFARVAAAFCGFYVSGADTKLTSAATMVVLMRDGQRTVLSMQNNYQGPPEKFAMVVPVPVVLQKENVKTLDRKVFDHVDQLAAPRLVEYWEQDPCAVEPPMAKGSLLGLGGGSGVGGGGRGLGVVVEAKFAVGEYDVVILSAKDAGGLDTWLKAEGYKIPAGSEPYLRPYVQSGMKFFVAKVDVTKVKFEPGPNGAPMATLSPLRFYYDSEKFNLPIRLGLANASGPQDLIVHILAKGQRYDVANYPNVTIPTNIDVAENARGQFSTFYASLFDRTVEKTPKAVVTEYAWDASTCDPCPTPALEADDLATLGADVLASAPPASPASQSAPSGAQRRGMFGANGFVLTRLHARYTKESLGEDLVFRQAPPITGGREVRGNDDALEHGATPGGFNNFQGRYVIRHAWTGPIVCAAPRRGRWGGPTADGGVSDSRAKAATNLAFAPRGGAPLSSFLAAAVPELGMGAAPSTLTASDADAGNAAGTGTPTPNDAAIADGGNAVAPTAKTGCSATGRAAGGDVPWTAFACATLLVAARTTRTRCTSRKRAALEKRG